MIHVLRLSVGNSLVCGLVLVLSAAGCRGGRGSLAGPAPEPQPLWEPVPVAARILYDNGGGIQDSLRMVVRDPDALRLVWTQATSRHADPPPPPPVDFQSEMLLVVAGGRMTPEDEIRVDSLAVRRERDVDGRTEQTLAALVRVTEGCRRFQVDAYPLEIVRVRRFEGPVRFVERRQRPVTCE
jgi:hypothetical protein